MKLFAWTKKELLFVTSVLLLLFGVSYFQLKIGQMKTRDAQRKADVELVGRALMRYYTDYKIFPPVSENGEVISCGDRGQEVCDWGGSDIVDVDNIAYLKNVPQDPFTYKGWRYVYEPGPDYKTYRIYVALEYRRDPAYRPDLTIQCGERVQCSWFTKNDRLPQ